MLVFIHLVNIMIGLLFWFFSPRGALVLWLLVGAYFGAALPWPQGGSVVYGTVLMILLRELRYYAHGRELRVLQGFLSAGVLRVLWWSGFWSGRA